VSPVKSKFYINFILIIFENNMCDRKITNCLDQ